jgi:hypothetical protein
MNTHTHTHTRMTDARVEQAHVQECGGGSITHCWNGKSCDTLEHKGPGHGGLDVQDSLQQWIRERRVRDDL